MKPWAPSVFDLVGLFLFLGLLCFGPPPGGDPGVFWHIQTGSWIYENSQIPTFDPFLFTTKGQTWIADQWLSDLVLFGVFQFGGWPLLHLLTIGIAVGAFAIVATAAVRTETQSILLQLIVTLAIATLGGVQWFTRPVIFAFVLFALTYWSIWIYSRDTKNGAILYALPPIFLLWANMHPSFLLGFVVCGALGIQAILNTPKEWQGRVFTQLGLIGLASLVASFATPYGLELYSHIFNLVGDPYFMSLNLEWQSPDFQHIAFRPFWVFILVLVFMTAAFGRGNSTLMDWLLLTGFLAFALLHRRYLPFLGIVAAVPLTCVLENARIQLLGDRVSLLNLFRIPTWRNSHGLCYLLVFAICWAYTATFGHVPFQKAEYSGPHPSYPWKALAHTKTLIPDPAVIPAKVFATPNWGGAITWSLWPNAKAFIDDRNSLNGQKRYEDFFAVSRFGPDWQSVLEEYDFDILILSPNSAAANAIPMTKDWVLRYRDANAVVFMRR